MANCKYCIDYTCGGQGTDEENPYCSGYGQGVRYQIPSPIGGEYCLKDFDNWLKLRFKIAGEVKQKYINKKDDGMATYSRGYEVAFKDVLNELNKLREPPKEV